MVLFARARAVVHGNGVLVVRACMRMVQSLLYEHGRGAPCSSRRSLAPWTLRRAAVLAFVPDRGFGMLRALSRTCVLARRL